VSISGKTLQDNLEMLDRIAKKINDGETIAGVELNLACPNVIDKPIIAYDIEPYAMIGLSTYSVHYFRQKVQIHFGIEASTVFRQ
jgi:hypothetical protein